MGTLSAHKLPTPYPGKVGGVRGVTWPQVGCGETPWLKAFTALSLVSLSLDSVRVTRARL
jgi:hypothetical protein